MSLRLGCIEEVVGVFHSTKQPRGCRIALSRLGSRTFDILRNEAGLESVH